MAISRSSCSDHCQLPRPRGSILTDAECRIHLDAIDEVSLFTWCRHFDHREVIQIPIGNLCHLISTRIRDTWDIRIPGTTLELRASDYWGETVQLAADKTIAETLDTWVPRWRLHGKLFPGTHDAPLFGTYPVIATFLASFYLDDSTAE